MAQETWSVPSSGFPHLQVNCLQPQAGFSHKPMQKIRQTQLKPVFHPFVALRGGVYTLQCALWDAGEDPGTALGRSSPRVPRPCFMERCCGKPLKYGGNWVSEGCSTSVVAAKQQNHKQNISEDENVF